MDCELLRENYESFALGVLEGDEKAEIQAHVDRGCPVCGPGVRDAAELVAQLAWAAPLRQPPAALRRRLMASVRAQQPQRRWSLRLAWSIAAACIVFAVWASVSARSEKARLEQANRELAADAARYRQALAIVSAAGSRAVSLVSTAPETQLKAWWAGDAGLLLTARGMPQPATGRTFQLWVVPKQGNPVSAGIFEPDSQGRVLLIARPPADPARAAALAITEEPSGGRPQPTTKPIWVGPVS